MTVTLLSKIELLQNNEENKIRWELKLNKMRWNEIQQDAFYSDEALTRWEYIWARCLSWIDDEYWT